MDVVPATLGNLAIQWMIPGCSTGALPRTALEIAKRAARSSIRNAAQTFTLSDVVSAVPIARAE
jgi:hypothetical protein